MTPHAFITKWRASHARARPFILWIPPEIGRPDGPQRPAEPREFADDEAVTALQEARQLVEASALLGGLPGGGGLDELVDADVVRSCVLEDGEALAANVLLRGRDPQVGDGLHGLSMECSVAYCI